MFLLIPPGAIRLPEGRLSRRRFAALLSAKFRVFSYSTQSVCQRRGAIPAPKSYNHTSRISANWFASQANAGGRIAPIRRVSTGTSPVPFRKTIWTEPRGLTLPFWQRRIRPHRVWASIRCLDGNSSHRKNFRQAGRSVQPFCGAGIPPARQPGRPHHNSARRGIDPSCRQCRLRRAKCFSSFSARRHPIPEQAA